ncbi:hypothetical protein PHLGIDRAFT_127414 [Phlebiopsis gigantea 11061_1 CR5-6]|uniref:F-box domain-containing protein n=1 Tax=Phlebiopsis gigantea (strain 11061_1 CR5-6) TaxID=745531 RepID=A0A0C3NRM4_PHLG1|nr:hypothetical protein PHLGIDRAFT_127414 [Phlebiopsis gigantea 11061_1 CR5-6]
MSGGRRRHRGCDRLTQLPVDIVVEIVHHLAPIDLLHLARTDKTLRGFLLSRTSEPLWRTARKNVEGLPTCPQHMSEPAYANLAFGNQCHKCAKSGIKSALWPLSVRYCPTCKPTMIVKCQNECIYGDTCDDAVIPHAHDRTLEAHYHHLPDAVWMEKKGMKLSKKQREARKTMTREIMEHAAECEAWQQNLANLRRIELCELRERAIDEIEEKLREMGYGEDLDYIASRGASDEVNDILYEHADWVWTRKEKLTEKVWQRIRPYFISLVENIRQRRVREETLQVVTQRCDIFLSLYRHWWAEQDDRNVIPPWNEALWRDAVVDILLRPNDVEVTPDDFEPLQAYFTEWAVQWRERRDNELRKIVSDSSEFMGKIPEDVDPLYLAAAVFDCDGCRNGMGYTHMLPPLYPSILVHRCLCMPYLGSEASDNPICHAIEVIAVTGGQPFCHQRWDPRRLCIGKLHRRAVDIIKACEKDPITTTQTDMDELDVWFWCETCDKAGISDAREVMRWRDTFHHAATHDFMGDADAYLPPKWSVMSGPIVNQIKEFERAAAPHFEQEWMAETSTDWYSCTHCEMSELGLPELRDHITTEHSIPQTNIGPRDYHIHADSELYKPRPIHLLRPRPLEALSSREKRLLDNSKAFICEF